MLYIEEQSKTGSSLSPFAISIIPFIIPYRETLGQIWPEEAAGG